MNIWGMLADMLLGLHVAFALFNVLGLIAIWVGALAGWLWVHNRWFRVAHILAMGVVVTESVFGLFCPLTQWEYELRTLAGRDPRYDGSFMQYWAEQIFYHHWPEWVFGAIYGTIFILMVLSFFLVPVDWRTRRR